MRIPFDRSLAFLGSDGYDLRRVLDSPFMPQSESNARQTVKLKGALPHTSSWVRILDDGRIELEGTAEPDKSARTSAGEVEDRRGDRRIESGSSVFIRGGVEPRGGGLQRGLRPGGPLIVSPLQHSGCMLY